MTETLTEHERGSVEAMGEDSPYFAKAWRIHLAEAKEDKEKEEEWRKIREEGGL